MAQCNWCEKKGLFLKVNQYSLCDRCSAQIMPEVQGRLRIYEESVDLIDKTKKYDIAVSRCDLIIEQLEALKLYEKKGITFFKSSMNNLINQIISLKNGKINDLLKDELQSVDKKVKASATINTKVSTLNKAIMSIEEKIELLDSRGSDFENFKKELSNTISNFSNQVHEIKYCDFIENGKKAEFKENFKKALDQYLEALYIIENKQEFADTLDKKEISDLKNKVEELKSK